MLVTHHVDEIPPGVHPRAAAPDRAACCALGPIGDHADEADLSECFGLALPLERRDGALQAASVSADQLEQAAARTLLDLVGEEPLEHRAPQARRRSAGAS